MLTKSMKLGFVAVTIGLIVFVINWNLVEGGWWLFRYALAPGNLVLSFFSEEIDFWPKLILQLSGQFFVVSIIGFLYFIAKKRRKNK